VEGCVAAPDNEVTVLSYRRGQHGGLGKQSKKIVCFFENLKIFSNQRRKIGYIFFKISQLSAFDWGKVIFFQKILRIKAVF